jgi:anti-sigma regulatory factor (Ser/Thr protein kinase)
VTSAGVCQDGLHLTLARNVQAPGRARAAVAGFCERSGLREDSSGRLRLLVSELVSNAVVHSDASASSDIVLTARVLADGSVRVEVLDQGSGFEKTERAPSPDQAGGYGLYLVQREARSWGVDRDDGTRVWFELRA